MLESGKFAERWRLIAERFGIEVVRYELPWGEAFEAAEVQRLLEQHPDVVAVFSTLQETSTGVGHDIEAIGRVVRDSPALLVVDGISGVGAMECRTDAWGIDVLVVGAQKAMMTPPGAGLSGRQPAGVAADGIDRPAGLLFRSAGLSQGGQAAETPYTPAIPLIEALAESLRLIRSTGIETLWARSKLLSRATLAGIAALGLKPVAKRPAEGVSAVYLPEDIDGKRFLTRLEERFGIKLGGGQGPLKGKIFRIAQMGLVDEVDILGCLAAIELVLLEMGKNVVLGSAVAAAGREMEKDGI